MLKPKFTNNFKVLAKAELYPTSSFNNKAPAKQTLLNPNRNRHSNVISKMNASKANLNFSPNVTKITQRTLLG